MVDEGREGPLRLLLAVVLAGIVAAGTVDLVLDAPDDWRSPHVIFETLMIGSAMAVVVVLWAGWLRSRRATADLARRLEARRAERDAWRAGAERALSGIGQAIATQLGAWHLTAAEQDVALRLLRGDSHKAIAIDTGRGERTVRQHAVAVYRKAGVGSRAELAAFFLGGLRLPDDDRRQDVS